MLENQISSTWLSVSLFSSVIRGMPIKTPCRPFSRPTVTSCNVTVFIVYLQLGGFAVELLDIRRLMFRRLFGRLILSIDEPMKGNKTGRPSMNVLVCIRRRAVARELQIEAIDARGRPVPAACRKPGGRALQWTLMSVAWALVRATPWGRGVFPARMINPFQGIPRPACSVNRRRKR